MNIRVIRGQNVFDHDQFTTDSTDGADYKRGQTLQTRFSILIRDIRVIRGQIHLGLDFDEQLIERHVSIPIWNF